MKIKIWRGFHQASLRTLIAETWSQEELLILCPPMLQDFTFIRNLPAGDIEICGDWQDNKNQLDRLKLSLKGNSERRAWIENPVLGVFTSGTNSGYPRLVLYSKRNIESSLSAILELFEVSRINSIFCYPQPFHTFGLTLGYVMAIKLKVDLFASDGKYSKNAHALRCKVKDYGILTLGTPTHFFDLLSFLESNQLKLEPSYTCIVGGSSVSVVMWNKIRDVLKIEFPSIGYGCTEASPGIAHLGPGVMPLVDAEIGTPLPNVSLKFTKDAGLKIEGPSLCLAIIDGDQLSYPTSLTIRDNLDDRNNERWIFRGRLDLTLNRGGQKISLEAIENSIFNELGIHIVCSISSSERLGQDLNVLVKSSPESLKNPENSDGSSELAHLFEKIKIHMLEFYSLKLEREKTFFVPEFPVNQSMKLDRLAVAEFFRKD